MTNQSKEMNNLLVSIIIPTWNDEETIRACLESCYNQSYVNIEVIVVDNNSDDGTPDIVDDYPATLIREESGMAEARNIGYDYSSGEYIYHVDADMELTELVVEDCIEHCREKGFNALLVPEENVSSGYWSKCLQFGKRINQNEQEGNLRFLEKQLYESVGGHDSDRLSGEDWDLHERISGETNAKIGHINEIVHHHVESMTFIDLVTKMKRYAKSQSNIPEEERRNLEPKENIKKKIRNYDILLKSPTHTIGYVILNIINASLVRYYRKKDSK